MKMLALAAFLVCTVAIAQSSQPQNSSKSQDSSKVVEGCLLREGPDFFLQPTSGDSGLFHLSAPEGEDLIQHVGQRVRVRGSDQPSGKAPNTSAANQPVTPVEKQPAPSTVPSGTPDPNVPVTQLPQSAQAGEGTEGFRGNVTNRELYVSSVESISGSCKPAAAQKPH